MERETKLLRQYILLQLIIFMLVLTGCEHPDSEYVEVVSDQELANVLTTSETLYGTVYSPNGAYYARGNEVTVSIYDAKLDTLVIEYESKNSFNAFLGWASDSSSFYFQPYSGGLLGHRDPIHKLRLPDSEQTHQGTSPACLLNCADANLSQTDLQNINLQDVDLSYTDLREANLIGADLRGANLYGSKITGGTQFDEKWQLVWQIVNQEAAERDLIQAKLGGAYLVGVDLSDANLQGAFLGRAKLSESNLSGANLGETDLTEADLSQTDLTGANLKSATLTNVVLAGANLSNADLRRAKLWKVNLNSINLKDANLSNANLHDADLRYASLGQTDFRNADLRGANLHRLDFRGGDFRNADLRGADLTRAILHKAKFDDTTQLDPKWRRVWDLLSRATTENDLSGIDLSNANLWGGNLAETNLQEANLHMADLNSANMRRADLRGADLSQANLRNVNLRGADLRKADLTEANLHGVIYDNATQWPQNFAPETAGAINASP